MLWKISRLMCVSGSVLNAAFGMAGISMQAEIFWSGGSRHRPVEGVSNLLGQKLELATPNEAGKPIREDGKPLPFRHGEMSLARQLAIKWGRLKWYYKGQIM
jgi:hypothetical protein